MTHCENTLLWHTLITVWSKHLINIQSEEIRREIVKCLPSCTAWFCVWVWCVGRKSGLFMCCGTLSQNSCERNWHPLLGPKYETYSVVTRPIAAGGKLRNMDFQHPRKEIYLVINVYEHIEWKFSCNPKTNINNYMNMLWKIGPDLIGSTMNSNP